MSYAPMHCYSAGSARRLDTVVNKFYVNVGTMNVNNGNVNHGIQHSIAAQRTGDVHIYNHNETIDNRIGAVNYVLNLDNRKVEFISPYIGNSRVGGKAAYLAERGTYLLTGPSGDSYSAAMPEYHNSITTGLLKRRRPVTQFVAEAADVQDIVVETFEKLTGQQFPDNIVVQVLSEEKMRKAHEQAGGKWSPGIMGFAINRWPDNSQVFVRQNHLDALMLTLGHEIGHVVSPTLPDAVDEEAKAFAFELAFAKTIIDNNIAGLAGNFEVDFMPAANGLHDRAFAFV
ncbi:hypothetical protein KY363_06905, partial [Candidatus Woesearchaeota archaeon]|nr:hypothetical protein [Candidatus Woesearchaeota archaeon]